MNFGGDAKKAWKDIWGCVRALVPSMLWSVQPSALPKSRQSTQQLALDCHFNFCSNCFEV
jgi:hypothetical protein